MATETAGAYLPGSGRRLLTTSCNSCLSAFADTKPVDAVEFVGLLGGAFGLSVAAPQAIRVRRLGTFGVSRLTWMLMYASFCSWLGYGIREASPSQAITNGVAMLLGAWLLMALLEGQRWRWPFILGIAMVAPVVIVLVPPSLMMVILIGFSATRWPQVFRSFRAWREATPTPAVSVLTWILSLSSAALWLLYGVLDGRVIVMVTSTLAMAASILIILFTRLAARTKPPEAIGRV